MRRAVKVVSLLVATMMALAAAPKSAQAQSHAQLVWSQLNGAYERLSAEGYTSLNYVIGRINEGATDSWTFTLQAGTTYQIIGGCDSDCSDLDLDILNGTTSVGSDVLDDDVPIVTFVAARTATYTVKVIMAACSSQPCYFGFGIFQK